ncbi:MAG: hypothetical protein ACRER9_02730 [Gammaproteobacteria bacterium]
MNTRAAWVISLAIAVLCLQACGGGGGSGSNNPPPPQTYALNSAISAYEQENHNYNLTATNGGNTYTFQLSFTPGAMGSFLGQSAFTGTASATLSENGTVISNDIQTSYFLLGPFKPLGSVDTNGNVYVASNQTALPDNATIGGSGAYGTVTVYSDSTLTTIIGTLTSTWALNAGSGSDAIGCLNTVGTLNGVSETESDCYTLDANSNIIGLTITLDVNGTVLNFQ